jgi:hypothetical protein
VPRAIGEVMYGMPRSTSFGRAFADEHERALGALQQIRRAHDRARVGVHARDLGRGEEAHGFFGDLAADEVPGEIEVHAAGPPIERFRECEMHPFGDALGRVDLARPLAHGLRRRDLVQFLERTEAERAAECGAA